MKLRDLNPKLEGTVAKGVLIFDCPLSGKHRLRIPIHSAAYAEVDGVKHWHAEGDYPDSITLAPSINETQCWHGWIVKGEIT